MDAIVHLDPLTHNLKDDNMTLAQLRVELRQALAAHLKAGEERDALHVAFQNAIDKQDRTRHRLTEIRQQIIAKERQSHE